MTARHLVIGLDGLDLGVVRALGPARLPRIFEVMSRGEHAALESVQPPATLPNWTTFLTGVDPGHHGVFDFTTRQGATVRFTAGTVREAPTIAARLDALGLRCACIGFPGTWPPERLAHGVFVSGWDSPVAFEADRSFMWPTSLYDELRARFGPWRFDDVDEFAADTDGWHAGLGERLARRVGARTEVLLALMERERWDLFACYFGESDTASHHLWSLYDPRSPRRPDRPLTVAETEGLPLVYEALDVAVGRLVRAAGGADVEVTLLSDHGSGGSSDKVLYLNRALEEAGLLAHHEASHASSASWLAKSTKHVALEALPPRLKERLFRAAGAALPGWLESRARFAGIDFARTVAFSDELNYFPGVWLNVRDREPFGVVPTEQRSELATRVRDALLALRDPWSGAEVVRRVHARETLFEGPYVDRAPDLLLELALDAGYSYNLMPSAGAPPGTGPFRKLAPEEWLGRKGRSLAGSHRPFGFYAASGPRVLAHGEIPLRMVDATSRVLARMDAASELARVMPSVTRAPDLRAQDLARTEARLRALGYVD